MNKVISKVNKMMPFDPALLNDPVVVASAGGVITDLNEKFTEVFRWTLEELVGQNVHLLIPSKFIRKNVHDKKLAGYTYGKESRIIGKTRIVPICTPDDEEILSTIKLIPIKHKKEFCFLVCLQKIDLANDLFNFQMEFTGLQSKISKLSKADDFLEPSIDGDSIAKEISRLFAKELELLCNFIVENQGSDNVVTMLRYFLIQKPIGKLGVLRKKMDRVFGSDQSYLSLTCKRIIFPSIRYRMNANAIDNIQQQLFEYSTGEDST